MLIITCTDPTASMRDFKPVEKSRAERRNAFQAACDSAMLAAMSVAPPNGERTFQGIAVSPGVCQGRVVVLGKAHAASARQSLADNQLAAEVNRFKQALVATRQQLSEVQRRLTEKTGAEHAGVFEAHLLVLDDPEVNNEVLRFIQNDKVNAEFAYQTVAERYAVSLAAVDDEYLRERAADIRDIAARVLNNLHGRGDDGDLRHILKEPCIIVAHDLAPSQTAQMDRDKVLGFATDVGSRTSHTAIMARSMKIPAVVGLKTITSDLRTGDTVLLDGVSGLIIINPTDQTLFEYGQLARRQKSLDEKLHENRDKPAITLDGHRVTLSGNIEARGRFGIHQGGRRRWRGDYSGPSISSSTTRVPRASRSNTTFTTLLPLRSRRPRWLSARWTWAATNSVPTPTCRRR